MARLSTYVSSGFPCEGRPCRSISASRVRLRGQRGAKAHAGDEALVEVPAFRHSEVGQRLGACGRYGAVEDVAAVTVPLEEIPEDRLVALPRRLRDSLPAIGHWKDFTFRSAQISCH